MGHPFADRAGSYAAVALARSLLRPGASLTAAMVFEIAGTNLAIVLAVILALLISGCSPRPSSSAGRS